MSKKCENSLIGGESITPYPTPITNDIESTSNPYQYSINTGLDYLSLNIPVKYPDEQDKIRTFEKLLKIENLDYDLYLRKNKSSNHVLGEQHKYDESTSILINDSVSLDRDLTRIELKGQGCRDLEARYGQDYLTGYDNIIQKTLSYGGWATRFDIFVDVFNGDITREEITRKVRRCEYTSVPRKFREDGTKNCDDYSDDGWGLLFGKPGSGTILRIYDKKAEQISRGKTIDMSINTWLRFEIRFYKDIAKTMFLELGMHLDDLQNFALSILSGVIQFRTKNKEDLEHKYRWSLWSKWEKLLGDIKAIKPYNQFEKESSISISSNWYSRSATKIHEVDRFVLSKEDYYLLELNNRKRGLEKIVGSNSTLNEINKERQKKNLPKLNMKDLEEELTKVQLELDSYSLAEDEVIKRFSTDIYDDVNDLVKGR